MDRQQLNAIIAEYFKSRSNTQMIINLLKELHEQGYGDAFYHARGKRISRKLKAITLNAIQNLIQKEFTEDDE